MLVVIQLDPIDLLLCKWVWLYINRNIDITREIKNIEKRNVIEPITIGRAYTEKNNKDNRLVILLISWIILSSNLTLSGMAGKDM